MKYKGELNIRMPENGTVTYIGYYTMLEKIVKLMDKVSHEEKLKLIDKYIEIIKVFNK